MKHVWACVLVITATVSPAAAQSSPGTESVEQRLTRLEQLVSTLQTQVGELRATRSSSAPATANADRDVPAQARRGGSDAGQRDVRTGPLSWNGEFRLYFDSLRRPASSESAPLANTRGRYLFALGMQTALAPTVDLRARLSTGPANNPLTDIQDFGGGASKHPISIDEAFIDVHPGSNRVRLQAGRVDNPFNDRSRFVYDTDTRFNGATEVAGRSRNGLGFSRLQVLAGQYILTNPNVPVIAAGSPSTASNATASQALLATGLSAGQAAPSSALFQQGVVLEHRRSTNTMQRLTVDLTLIRQPNQLQLMSEPGGLFLVSTSTGLTPSSALPSLGNGTTTPGGGQFTASGFHIAHVGYLLEQRRFSVAGRTLPLTVDTQFARNLKAAFANDALMASVSLGDASPRRARVAYAFFRKEANSLLGQLTENDIAVSSSVNMAGHFARVEFGLARNIVAAANVSLNTFLADSDPERHFYVPFGRGTPRQRRVQFLLTTRF